MKSIRIAVSVRSEGLKKDIIVFIGDNTVFIENFIRKKVK